MSRGLRINSALSKSYVLSIAYRREGYHVQALYCYRKLCSLDPDNVHALWDRASLAKEVGELRTVRPFILKCYFYPYHFSP
jgi:hypothetical protein